MKKIKAIPLVLSSGISYPQFLLLFGAADIALRLFLMFRSFPAGRAFVCQNTPPMPFSSFSATILHVVKLFDYSALILDAKRRSEIKNEIDAGTVDIEELSRDN